MRSWFSTVRIRTTIVATLVVTVALVIGALVLLAVQRNTLLTSLERSADTRAADVAGLAKRSALPETLTAANEDTAFTQVVGASGKVLAASENLRGAGRVVTTAPGSDAPILITREIPRLGRTFRISARTVTTPTGKVTVYAGDSVGAVDETTDRLAIVLAFGLPLLAGLVGLTTWKVAGRALRPVEAIRSEVSEIGEGELHRRVPEPGTDDEVGRLARTMNAMLARLSQASDRQQAFVSDASHELQSPLTSLRARLEVNLASRDEPDWRSGEREALLEVTEMQRLVDDLLTLARLDAQPHPPAHIPVDLDDLVLAESQRIRSRGRVVVDTNRVSAGQTTGDPDQLRRALRNVLGNAERHAAGAVTASVQELADRVEVRISDDGAGIPEEDRERIFERFARIDDARTRDGTGTGLGLAITRAIVMAHGGRITVENGVAGACFVIDLPSAEPLTSSTKAASPSEVGDDLGQLGRRPDAR
ncbi:MAG: sensory histidine kinase [Actinomycetia bacterium]|nr:sensory histidine kinase [Actinomycetes bacterium]